MDLKPLTAERYLLGDFPPTLFPLSTTSFLVEQHCDALKKFVYTRILQDAHKEDHFLPQQRCYAAKKGYHLRRTVKLDPLAEFYIYDVVFRNRSSFPPDARSTRRSFGYRFMNGRPQSAIEAHADFRREVVKARKRYKYTLSLDIATYFNSLYHHDIVHGTEVLGWDRADSAGLGRFLREINAGRSIDCLPHGLHPCKALGADFLRFIENTHRLQSSLSLRFLDDIHLFSDSANHLTADLIVVQELLGERGLSLNTSKTVEGPASSRDIATQVDRMKAKLLEKRRQVVVFSGEEDTEEEIEIEVRKSLSSKQVDYLLGLINSADVEEADAELVLTLLRNHSDEVFPRIGRVLGRFPGLTKSLYNFARFTSKLTGLDDLVATFISEASLATEYQLFWLGKLTEDCLMSSPHAGDILGRLYQHPNGTSISKAKILEIPDQRFGLPELREEKLRGGASNWEAWSAAVGCRTMSKAKRNHLLGYFANASAINRLVADAVKTA